MPHLTIDVFADVVCPWCYIGERRMAAALAERPDLDVTWRWHPFQLHVGMPKGVDWRQFRAMKFGSEERADEMTARVSQVGAAEGIEFHMDRIATAPNTEDAHRVILAASRDGLARAAAGALYRAYFALGVDLNDRDALADIAAEIGLDRDEIRGFLDTDIGRDRVAASQEDAERLGVDGVPFFILNERWAISGAQPPELWQQALDRIFAEAEAQAGQAG